MLRRVGHWRTAVSLVPDYARTVPPLFPDFLENAASYDAVVAFWHEVVRDIERSLGQEDEWGRWIPMHFADGVTPIDEPGNPIFDGYSQAEGRAFRIIQHMPVPGGPEIAAWTKTYDLEDEPTLLPDSELVLALSLSEESARTARALLHAWMQPDTTPSAMDAVIAALLSDDADGAT
jgi:hypothetical protein